MSNEVEFTVPAARYAALMQGAGIPMSQLVSSPAKGAFFIRTVILDLTSNHIGSVEIPLSLIENLPPLLRIP